MRERQTRQIAAATKSEEFARANAELFPEIQGLNRMLQGHLKRIVGLSVDDITTKRRGDTDGPGTRHLAREIRRMYLIPISRAGKRLFRLMPGKERALEVPATRATAAEIAKAARVMLKAVRGAAKLFVEIGFARTFIQDCTRRTRELERLVAGRHQTRLARPGVVRSLTAEVAAARHTIGVMDAMIEAHPGDNAQKRAWRQIKKVGKRKGRPPKPRGKKSRPRPDDGNETP